ncbi:MAG: hypothetical protein R2867_45155 [Caldilineaceae bacterium]
MGVSSIAPLGPGEEWSANFGNQRRLGAGVDGPEIVEGILIGCITRDITQGCTRGAPLVCQIGIGNCLDIGAIAGHQPQCVDRNTILACRRRGIGDPRGCLPTN